MSTKSQNVILFTTDNEALRHSWQDVFRPHPKKAQSRQDVIHSMPVCVSPQPCEQLQWFPCKVARVSGQAQRYSWGHTARRPPHTPLFLFLFPRGGRVGAAQSSVSVSVSLCLAKCLSVCDRASSYVRANILVGVTVKRIILYKKKKTCECKKQ